jgi:hypothetical protein
MRTGCGNGKVVEATGLTAMPAPEEVSRGKGFD